VFFSEKESILNFAPRNDFSILSIFSDGMVPDNRSGFDLQYYRLEGKFMS
jgi:hypothetical protein